MTNPQGPRYCSGGYFLNSYKGFLLLKPYILLYRYFGYIGTLDPLGVKLRVAGFRVQDLGGVLVTLRVHVPK